MPNKPQNSAVWFEIPVTDMARAKKFYETVLDTQLLDDDSGPNPMAMFPVEDADKGVSGHIYPGTPPKDGGNTVHLLAPSPLSAAVERVAGVGGQVLSDPIEIPAGRFVYCKDPDGNSIGLFEYSS